MIATVTRRTLLHPIDLLLHDIRIPTPFSVKMSRPSSIISSMCRSCRRTYMSTQTQTQTRRYASSNTNTSSSTRHSHEPSSLAERLGIRVEAETPPAEPQALDQIAEALRKPSKTTSSSTSTSSSEDLSSLLSGDLRSIARSARDEAATRPSARVSADEPYHLTVYAHKHNTHITFTEPSRNPILSLSTGNLGLRKAQRSSYDASYQLASYTFRKMAEKQWRIGGKKNTSNPMLTLADVRKPGAMSGGAGIEVIMRGYGPGREAFQKALLGTEGRMIKPLVSKVTDSTRLKFGGTRSPKVRRLG
ncbi:Small ribosomal subunit protein uS11m [Exophiala dermatitidis]